MRLLLVVNCGSAKVGRTAPARELYTSSRIQGFANLVDSLRSEGHDVAYHILSAKHGLVEESTELKPYDETFSGQDDRTVARRGEQLGVYEDLVEAISQFGPSRIFLGVSRDYIPAVLPWKWQGEPEIEVCTYSSVSIEGAVRVWSNDNVPVSLSPLTASLSIIRYLLQQEIGDG